MTHAERIRAAAQAMAESCDLDWSAMFDRHSVKYAPEAVRGYWLDLAEVAFNSFHAAELDEHWTREGNYVERAETEGELHG